MNSRICQVRVMRVMIVVAALLSLASSRASAQFAAPPPDTTTPRANAPFDLNGYWVAVVTEDWRYRMVTPVKGDFPGVPVNAAGRRVASQWDPDKDTAAGNQCKAYGAGAIMRVPERLHISWEDEKTVKLETDAGTQTRVFHFGGTPPAGAAPSWQGYSVASWEGLRPRGFVLPVVAGSGAGGGARPGQEGYLKVVTTELRPGYLRKNGVPYGENAVVEEYFDSFKEPNGDIWLIVTAIVTDPEYLDNSYIVSSQFKKLPDASGWNPTPCEAK
jgi:hypothetical protein